MTMILVAGGTSEQMLADDSAGRWSALDLPFAQPLGAKGDDYEEDEFFEEDDSDEDDVIVDDEDEDLFEDDDEEEDVFYDDDFDEDEDG